MRALARKLQAAVRCTRKTHAVAEQVADNIAGRANHDVHGLRVVFKMPGAHGVLIVGVVVSFIPQHADAALRKVGVAFLCRSLGDDCNFFAERKIERAVQSCHAAADDNDIGFFKLLFLCFHSLPPQP